MRGTMKLIIGNMFAGKTTELISRIDIMRKHGRRRILILKPIVDTRSGSGKIKNFHGRTLEAVEIPTENARHIIDAVNEEEELSGHKFDVIAIDEVQFFTYRSGIYRAVNQLLESGYDVIAAGLRLDFRGEPFGSTLELIGLCTGMHDVILLHSYCTQCGKPAHLPQRLIDGEPAPYESSQIQVGGKESYEARCTECHRLPGRPLI